MESRARTRRGIVPALCAGLLLAVPACGPTAEQLKEREAAASRSPSAAAPSRSAPPGTEPTAVASFPADPPPSPVPQTDPAPSRVGVTGTQAGMPQPVQDACQWLLHRDPDPVPGTEAGDCVSAAMAAGGGGVQTLQTDTSWLPAGTYNVRFATGSGFAMTLQDTDQELAISIRDGERILRRDDSEIPADPDGSAEEAYAAVLADAAELTVRPERVAALLAPAEEVEVNYGAVLNGTVYTQISGSFDTADGKTGNSSETDTGSSAVLPAASFSLHLDHYYRPVQIEITGRNQGITSKITAVNTQWGTRPLS